MPTPGGGSMPIGLMENVLLVVTALKKSVGTHVSIGVATMEVSALMTIGAHTLFLHIGRGKSGSSTIQSLARDHAPFMASAGVHCPLTSNGLPNHARLAAALCDQKRDPQTLRDFRDALEKSPHPRVFISGEALFSITRDGMRHLKRLLDGREIRILAYVRDYPSWLPSVYAQRTKKATSGLNFDDYFASIRENVTILPRVERWASIFGWKAVRVRTLDPVALTGANLISDVLDALSIEGAPPYVPSLNVAPHWITLELQRALANAVAGSPLGKIDAKSARTTLRLFEACAGAVQPSRAHYLTREQWKELALRYMRDMATVGERTGTWFPVSLKEPEERSFLPGLDAVPDSVKADILSKLRDSGLARDLKPEMRALVARLMADGEAPRFILPVGSPGVWAKHL